jgi:hypothetical protein
MARLGPSLMSAIRSLWDGKRPFGECRPNDASTRRCDRLGCMGAPRVDELALPKSVDLSVNKAVIRGMSVEVEAAISERMVAPQRP